MGILRDKEQEEIVKATVPLADQVLTISTKGARGFSALELAEICSRYKERVTATDGIQEALELAYLMASPEDIKTGFFATIWNRPGHVAFFMPCSTALSGMVMGCP